MLPPERGTSRRRLLGYLLLIPIFAAFGPEAAHAVSWEIKLVNTKNKQVEIFAPGSEIIVRDSGVIADCSVSEVDKQKFYGEAGIQSVELSCAYQLSSPISSVISCGESGRSEHVTFRLHDRRNQPVFNLTVICNPPKKS